MRERYEQSAAAINKKMKREGKSVPSQAEILKKRNISHNKAAGKSAGTVKGKAPTHFKLSAAAHRQGPPPPPPLSETNNTTPVKSVPTCSTKPSQTEMDKVKDTPVLGDDATSITSSFTSEDEEVAVMPEQPLTNSSGGKVIPDETIQVDDVDDFFARVEAQLRKAQSLSSAACHSPSVAANDEPPSAAALARAKDDISRLVSIPFQDVVLVPENYSALNAALSVYATADRCSIGDDDDTLKKLQTTLPDLCSTLRRGKKDQAEFFAKAEKKALLIEELKKGQELYFNLKDRQDKILSAMDSIKNQMKELKRSWKEAEIKTKAVQVQKLSLGKDCFAKCSALDVMEAELRVMEQKKETADSDIARAEACWTDFKHKLMKCLL
ncbi:unnamed protein product [Cuscuta epithymum]|uniref:Uncharacterized protein n=1 Tax=Cuscuta epithymum TaxID=186058 RepID=A0AAV0FRZ8_9ASTE|nr:unnamed protein product [Cuscuta epithymum]